MKYNFLKKTLMPTTLSKDGIQIDIEPNGNPQLVKSFIKYINKKTYTILKQKAIQYVSLKFKNYKIDNDNTIFVDYIDDKTLSIAMFVFTKGNNAIQLHYTYKNGVIEFDSITEHDW